MQSTTLRRVCLALFILLLAALLATQSWAYDSSTQFQVRMGNKTVIISAPEGYLNPKPVLPQMWQIQETFVPDTNELIAYFISKKDIESMLAGRTGGNDRYFAAQVVRQIKTMDMDPGTFSQAKAQIKMEQEHLLEGLEGSINEELQSASQEVSRDMSTAIDIQMESSQGLGVYQDEPNALSFGMLVNYVAQTDAGVERFSAIVGTSMVLVKDRLLFLYTYAMNNRGDSYEWVKKNSVAWAEQIMAENQ